jgi:DNA-binding IclR family transcriptional regulator
VVFLGQVERIERTGRQPLVFGGGRYLVAQPHDIGMPTAGANIARLQAVRLATRALVDLSDELDETLGLGVWGNKGPTIVRWEEASTPVSDNLRTGLVLPVLTSATGLAFAAWLPRETTAPFINAEIAQGGPVGEGITSQGVAEQLGLIRANGIVRLVGTDAFADLYGGSISAASVPVFDQSGAMVLALTAIGSTQRLDLDESSPLVRGLRDCAARLSQRLGGRSPADQASNDPQEKA